MPFYHLSFKPQDMKSFLLPVLNAHFSFPHFLFLAQIMNAIKAVDDILRPKSPSTTKVTHQYSDLSSTESQSQEKRTTLIKMAGSSSGAGGTTSNEISPPTASFQETSTVSHFLFVFLHKIYLQTHYGTVSFNWFW